MEACNNILIHKLGFNYVAILVYFIQQDIVLKLVFFNFRLKILDKMAIIDFYRPGQVKITAVCFSLYVYLSVCLQFKINKRIT